MRSLWILLAALVVFTGSAFGTPIVIDSFNVSDIITCRYLQVAPSGSGSCLSTGATDAYGGAVTLSIQNTAGLDFASVGRNNFGSGDGALNLNAGVNGIAAFGYSGPARSLAGQTLVSIDFISVNVGTTMIMDISGGGHSSTYSQDVTAAGNILVPFAAFAGTFDFVADSMTSFTLTLDSSAGRFTDADIRIDNLQIDTPEPATIVLIGAGLIGLGLLRRKFAR